MSTKAKKRDYSESNFSDIYGFLLWIFIRIFGLLYMAWASLPDWYIESHKITYYPHQLWAMSIPTYFCVSFWCLVIGYVGYNFYNTLEWTSIYSIRDGFAECPINAHAADIQQIKETIAMHNKIQNNHNPMIYPPVPNTCDLDIVYVNEILFDTA